ncbi:hypothetical protein [Peribacillus glennii]|uniref:hypothetical protein n=1 Tax=Peribacillus glennii TaxID=2303991 RepID=UPI001F1E02A5|nr:hypothetical protein [Peribacillus glennii]
MLVSFSQNKVSKDFRFSWIKNSQFANSLKIPSHMGGLNRTESSFIGEFLEADKAKYSNNRTKSNEKFVRKEK